MRYRAVFLDLDGCLVTRAKAIDDGDRAAVAAARSAGIGVYVNTGRSTRGAVWAHGELGASTPVFCFNGAVIHDPATGADLDRVDIEDASLTTIFDLVDRHDLPALSFIGDRIFAYDHPEPVFQELAALMDRAGVHRLSSRSDLPREEVTKVWILAPPELVEGLEAETAGPGCRWVRPGMGESFSPAGFVLTSATGAVEMKRRPLTWIAQRDGIDPSEMVAVGDHDNDVEALRAAGLGVAVASSSPRALDVADRVIGLPEEGSVAALLRELAASG